MVNALRDTKGFPHETIIACAQLVQMDCEYCAGFKTNKHLDSDNLVYYQSPDDHVHV